jgi:cytidine deaminase
MAPVASTRHHTRAKVISKAIENANIGAVKSIDWEKLFSAAELARQRAYAPYSKYAVGVAVLTTDGTVFSGCNVENASYGLTVCAERNALAACVLAGKTPRAVTIIVDGKRPASPCGACRQVLAELCPPNTPVRSRTLSSRDKSFTVKSLLPAAFSPSDL